MSSKINVVCESCKAEFRAMDDELSQLACPKCKGKLAPKDAGQQQSRDNAPAQSVSVSIEKDSPAPQNPKKVEEQLADISSSFAKLNSELSKVIVGQKEVIEEIIVAIFANGHCLLEGVPGLAKTLLISSLSKAMSLSFKRIQFTPDLMPSDITGTEIIQENPQTNAREFRFVHGPIFANVVLADEINRTPPKTQASMLEAMQEKQVSVGGRMHPLPKPFFVLATQNPLEQEGTYPLPEAQQDRFLFKIHVGYPSEAEEKKIIEMVSGQKFGDIQPVISAEQILAAQKLVTGIPVAETVVQYATKLVRSTRLNQSDTPDFIKKWVAWGCGPRASIALVSAAKAVAALGKKSFVSCDDIARVAHPVMRHRLAVNYAARAEGLNSDAIIDKLLATLQKH